MGVDQVQILPFVVNGMLFVWSDTRKLICRDPKKHSWPFLPWNQIFCHVSNMEPVKLETGMQLLRALKEELVFHVSRTGLDFLLSMCVKAGDSTMAMAVWKEYESAGLPYNVLTRLRFIFYLCTYDCYSLFEFLFLLIWKLRCKINGSS